MNYRLQLVVRCRESSDSAIVTAIYFAPLRVSRGNVNTASIKIKILTAEKSLYFKKAYEISTALEVSGFVIDLETTMQCVY